MVLNVSNGGNTEKIMRTKSKTINKESVVDKLSTYFNNQQSFSDGEKDITYFMNLLRQLLEIEGAKIKWHTITFFSSWCLHAEINKSDKWFLNLIEDPVQKHFKDELREKGGLSSLGNKEKQNIYVFHIGHQLIRLKNLKKQLNQLEKQYFDSLVTNTTEWWEVYREKLLSTILHRPLVIKVSKSLIDYLIMEKSKSMESANPDSYVVDVIIKFKDGSKLSASYLE